MGFEKHREDSISSFKDDASISGLSFFERTGLSLTATGKNAGRTLGKIGSLFWILSIFHCCVINDPKTL